MSFRRSFVSAALPCMLLCVFSMGCYAASLTVWPIDPYIQPPSQAVAIRVRNTGNEPAHLQLRIYRWVQERSEDELIPQDEIVISPPMALVEPQAQQLFRIVHRSGAPNYSSEVSYRILIDEIPNNQKKSSAPLQFQMRYSLPFFIFPQVHKRDEKRDENFLRFRITNPKKPEITVVNHGSSHFRLSQVFVQNGNTRIPIAEGLLGYVLPGSTMTWPIPLDKLTPQQIQSLVHASEITFTQNHHQYRVRRLD